MIAELIRAMVNHSDKLMVIVAGYAGKMQEFLDSNEGLRSRFTRGITLPSYTVDELVEITILKATKGGSIIRNVEPLRQAYTDLANATALDTTGRRRPALDVLGNGRFADTISSGLPERNVTTASTSPASSGRTPPTKSCRPSPVRICAPR